MKERLIVMPLWGRAEPLPVLYTCSVGIGNLDARRTLKLSRPISSERLFLHLTTEIIALTVFLVAAGGPDNPFIILYVIHVAMAAVMLKQRHALLITACAIVCYAIGFIWHLPLEARSLSQASLIKGGQVIAFAVTSVSVCAFVMGVSGALRYQNAIAVCARSNRTYRSLAFCGDPRCRCHTI